MALEKGKMAQDVDDPIKMKAIVLSLRMYIDSSYGDRLDKERMKEIAYGQDKTTQLLVEVANMK